MTSLRELQSKLVAHMRDGNAAAHAAANAIPAQERVDFHRTGAGFQFRDTLRAIYPVIERLVGAHFFDRAADTYRLAHPTAKGASHLVGEHFADFVDTWTATGELPYLADVARLEWCIEQAFHSADLASLSLQDLAAVPAERQYKLTFELHPSCRLLRSTWPVQRVWQANLPGSPVGMPIDLSRNDVHLLIHRQEHAVVIETLDHGEFSMLHLLASGRVFDEAWRGAVSAQPDFDLTGFMQKHVVAGVFADFGRQRPATNLLATESAGELARRRRDQR